MKREKSQLKIGDRTFLENIVHLLRPCVSSLVAVGPRKSLAVDSSLDVEWTQDERSNQGPLEGIRVGLKCLEKRCEFAFVTACDVPTINPNMVRLLRDMTQDVEAVVPKIGDRIFGMSAIYRTEVHQQIDGLLDAGHLRVSSLAGMLVTKFVGLEAIQSVDPNLECLQNINTPEEYSNLLRHLGLS